MAKRPGERSVEELLHLGVINIDKPSGPTSHQVSAWVKQILGVEKAGHGGTLDPRVTGVLPVALNDSTRALGALLAGDKEYIGVLHLHQDVERKRVEEILSRFEGEIYQLPPVRAAVKRELRTRTVHELNLIEMDGRNV
ncbi:MAG: RNA-guided pseudouridylation complex pseudouridine synthase subunit Cbf5, partial [Thermoplasmata archaeon]